MAKKDKLVLIECGAPVWIKLSQFGLMIGENGKTVLAWLDDGASDIVSIVHCNNSSDKKARYRIKLEDAVNYCLDRNIKINLAKYVEAFGLSFDIDAFCRIHGIKKEEVE